MLIFAAQWFSDGEYWVAARFGVLALSLVAGRAGKAFFEDGLANSRRVFPSHAASLVRSVAVMAVAALAFTGLHYGAVEREARARQERLGLIGTAEYPGVAAIAEGVAVPQAPQIPPEEERKTDFSWQVAMNFEERCVQTRVDPEVLTCQSELADEGPLVVLLGGSHLGQCGGQCKSSQ